MTLLPWSQPSPTTLPSDRDVLDALIRADGNVTLTAERLHVLPLDIYESLSDPTTLAKFKTILQVKSMMQAWEVIHQTGDALLEVIANAGMDGYDLSKTYTAVLGRINEITAPSTTPATVINNTNQQNNMFQDLPPSVAEALSRLINAPASPPVQSGTDSNSNSDNNGYLDVPFDDVTDHDNE